MADLIFDRFDVVDIDTHVTEPADTWTARVSKRWGDRVPHIRQIDGRDLWFAGDVPIGMPGAYSMAGFDGAPPEYPLGYASIPRATYDAKARLELMDQEKIRAQVVYPNVGGFGAGGFRKVGEPQLMLECVSAYNDFLVDWCSADPKRLLGVAALPFWDIKASVEELQRCAGLGFKTILMCNQPQDHGQPLVRDKHWDPIWAAAQEAELTVSFHIGGGDFIEITNDPANIGFRANFARFSTLAFIDNARCLTDVICGGIPHRFPKLQMVSVESGVSWIPFLLEALDWQWQNGMVRKEHPEYDLLPSEYFRRQIYSSFWFEEQGIGRALELYPDNILFETDYPHPTCQAPGPATLATRPMLYAEKTLKGVPEKTLKKVLNTTAARLYGLA